MARFLSVTGWLRTGLVVGGLVGGWLLGAAVRPAAAADQDLVGILHLLPDDQTAKALNLSPTQKQKLEDLIDRREAAAFALVKLPAEEQKAKLAEFRAESERLGLAELNPVQRTKLRQLRVSRQGMGSLFDPEVIEKLKLTPDQQAEAVKLQGELRLQVANASWAAEANTYYSQQHDAKLAALLSAEQRKSWEQLSGAKAPAPYDPATFPKPPVSAQIAAESRSAAPQRVVSVGVGTSGVVVETSEVKVAQPAVTATDKPSEKPASLAGEKPAEKAIEKSDAKPAEQASDAKPSDLKPGDLKTDDTKRDDSKKEPIKSFNRDSKSFGDTKSYGDGKSRFDAKSGPLGKPGLGNGATSEKPRAVATEPVKASADGKVGFAFRYQPWPDVLDHFAREADLSLVMDTAPTGTFNYVDTKRYSPEEAIDLLNKVLIGKGMVLVRNQRMLMLLNVDAIPPVLVPVVEPQDLANKGEYELVKVLFPLARVTPDEAQAEIRPLVGPQGAIVLFAKSKQIQVTEMAGRLRTIAKVVAALENSSDQTVHPVELKHVTADSILGPLKQFLGIPNELSATPDGSIRILVEPASGKLLVTGRPDKMTQFHELLKILDQPTPGGEILEAPQLEIYPVNNADPNTVLQVLQVLMIGQADVRLAIDPKTGSLVALARPKQQATIRGILKEMEGGGKQFEVIKLRRVDPQLAVLAIQKLFGGDGTANANAPVVDAETTTRQLLIRGTASQIEAIRGLLAKMGEVVDAAGGEREDRGRVRAIPLTTRDAQAVLEQMETLWSVQSPNRIRVVTPSGSKEPSRIPSRRPGATADEEQGATTGAGPAATERAAPERAAIERPAIERPAVERAATERTVVPGDADLRRPSYEAILERLKQIPPDKLPPGVKLQFRELRNVPAESPPADGNRDRREPPRSEQPRSEQPPRKESPREETPRKTAERRIPAMFAQNTVDKSAPAKEGAGKSAAAPKRTGPPAEIIVTVTPNGLIIASEDTEALDKFEDMIATLTGEMTVSGPEYTVFYLKHAKAEVAAELLEDLFGTSSSGSSGGGSLLGNLAGAALGDVGGGLVGSLLGGGRSSGGTSFSGSTVQIVPDPRLNALIVHAESIDLDSIDQLLKVIDQPASPEDVQTAGKPRFIPVYHNSASDIAEIVKQVYPDRISGAGGANQQRGMQNPQEMFQQMMQQAAGGRGGRGGRGGGGGNNRSQARTELEKMTVSVDSNSNSVIVVAPDFLFAQVKELVEQLDQVSLASREISQVVTLKRANPQAVQQALVGILGDKVQSSTSVAGSRSRNGSTTGSTSQPNFGGPPGGGFPFGGPGGGFPFGGGTPPWMNRDGGGDRGSSFGSPRGFGGDRGGGDSGGDGGGFRRRRGGGD